MKPAIINDLSLSLTHSSITRHYLTFKMWLYSVGFTFLPLKLYVGYQVTAKIVTGEKINAMIARISTYPGHATEYQLVDKSGINYGWFKKEQIRI